jgi:hypothetical protein
MFRAHVLIIRRSKLHYTASGIITPISVMIPEAVWLITEIKIITVAEINIKEELIS